VVALAGIILVLALLLLVMATAELTAMVPALSRITIAFDWVLAVPAAVVATSKTLLPSTTEYIAALEAVKIVFGEVEDTDTVVPDMDTRE
jgi:ABC-type uncharacterized transport system YnjBCD permease subunit